MSAVLRLVYQPPPPEAQAPRPRRRSRDRGGSSPRSRAVVLVAVAVGAFVGGGGDDGCRPGGGPCNGHRSLCDRARWQRSRCRDAQLDVGAAAGLVLGAAGAPIGDQLRDGIHGLLIDTHYADRLQTASCARSSAARRSCARTPSQDGVNPDAVDAALRLRERLGFKGEGERGMYLCHSFCELGATQLGRCSTTSTTSSSPTPTRSSSIVNQDYVTPEDFVRAVRDADLEEFVYRGPVGERLADAARDDRPRPAARAAGREPGRRAPWYRLVYEQHPRGDAVLVPEAVDSHAPAALDASCGRTAAPRVRRCSSQPLDHDRSAAAAVDAAQVNALRAAARAPARVRALRGTAPEPGGRELLPARRPVPGGRPPEPGWLISEG